MNRKGRPSSDDRAKGDEIAALSDRDRQNTTVHEVGHLTVALALGFPAEVWIEPTETTDPTYKKTWTGSCRANFLFRRPTNRENTMIGLAGWLAEVLHEKPAADIYEELSAVDLSGIFDEGLSDSDLASLTVNNRWIVRWAEQVREIFTKYEAFRTWAMTTLSEQGFISEPEAVAAFPDRRKFAKYRAHAEAIRKRLANHAPLQSSNDGD
jgi:hypothetical protein